MFIMHVFMCVCVCVCVYNKSMLPVDTYSLLSMLVSLFFFYNSASPVNQL